MTRRINWYWSVRRELWEHRSLSVVPIGTALLVLAVYASHVGRQADAMIRLGDRESALRTAASIPFSMAASVILLLSIIVGASYCLDALTGERRDRSILFWKSLPVSDLETVAAKASIPMLVVPVIAMAVALAAQLVMLVLATVVLAAKGGGAATMATSLPIFTMTAVMVYGVFVHALWFAPIYAWFLLASAWARRSPALWALMPFAAAAAFETGAIGTSHVGALLKYRVTGAMEAAFTLDATRGPITSIAALAPLEFLATPGLWAGLAFAAVCFAAAVRLRRRREPI